VAADELVARAPGRKHEARERAAAFLKQFLAGGPRSADDIWQAAQKAGLSARTVQRAKNGLNIRSCRVQAEGKPVSYWLLPGQQLPAALSRDPEIDRLIAELERQFPPQPPLEQEELEGDDEED
jgi:hypothetical protein